MKNKIVGEIKQAIDEKLNLGWNSKTIADFLKDEKELQISSMAIIKYRRKRARSLEMHEDKRVSRDSSGPVVNELRRTRHRLERLLKGAEKTIAPATPTDVDKLRRRIIELYQAEIDALKSKSKEEETDITLLFKKEAERQPDESKRDFRGVVLRALRKSKRTEDSSLPLPEGDSERLFKEEDNQ